MPSLPVTGMNFNSSSGSTCAQTSIDCQNLISSLSSQPSRTTISEIVQRVLHRDLLAPASGFESVLTPVNGQMYKYVEARFEGCVVHFAKLGCSPYDQHRAAIVHAVDRLSAGDIIILESLDLSKGHCFPYHSAFDRFQEILSIYQDTIGHPSQYDKLKLLVDGLHSESIIQMGVPVKLQGDQKLLPATVLECIRPCIEMTDMISIDEFDAVTAELRRIGRINAGSMSSISTNRILYTL